MRQWKWWMVVCTLIASNGVGFGLLAFERSKPAPVSESTESLSRRLAIAEAEAAALKNERHRIADQTKSMTRQLKARTVKTASRNVSSAVAEAVPYIGIPVMLAVTAADLYDACQTMKEIDALHRSIGLDIEETKDVCGMTVPSLKHVFGHVKKRCEKSKECSASNVTVTEDERATQLR
jgi:hypothetical protein